MKKMTVTESLAEVGLICKKVKSLEEFISANAGRTSVMNDPLEKSGGTPATISKSFQAMNDLHLRLTKIRTAIQESNVATKVVVGEREMTVADALTYRREVAPGYQAFLKLATQECNKLKQQFERNPQILKDAEGKQTIIQPVFHIDLEWLRRESDRLEAFLGELDGKLSLLNATTFIEV